MSEKQEQVAAQCRVVAKLAKVIAEVHDNLAWLHEKQAPFVSDLVDIQGGRTARLMETLGDILNEMDAVTPDDEAEATPVFEKAQQLFPPPPKDIK